VPQPQVPKSEPVVIVVPAPLPAPSPSPIPVETRQTTQTYTLFEGSFVAQEIRLQDGCPTTQAVIGKAGQVVLTRAVEEAGTNGTITLTGSPRYIVPSLRFLSRSIEKSRVILKVDDSQNQTVFVRATKIQ
jgi:hypothetical protein